MADSYLERVAGEIADLALADSIASGDEKIVDVISEILGASSQTLQEAYLTAVRVRRAEARARELLAERAGKSGRVKSRLLGDDNQAAGPAKATTDTGHNSAPAAEETQSEEDAAFADVLNTLDEFLHTDDGESDPKPSVTPTKPSRN